MLWLPGARFVLDKSRKEGNATPSATEELRYLETHRKRVGTPNVFLCSQQGSQLLVTRDSFYGRKENISFSIFATNGKRITFDSFQSRQRRFLEFIPDEQFKLKRIVQYIWRIEFLIGDIKQVFSVAAEHGLERDKGKVDLFALGRNYRTGRESDRAPERDSGHYSMFTANFRLKATRAYKRSRHLSLLFENEFPC